MARWVEFNVITIGISIFLLTLTGISLAEQRSTREDYTENHSGRESQEQNDERLSTEESNKASTSGPMTESNHSNDRSSRCGTICCAESADSRCGERE